MSLKLTAKQLSDMIRAIREWEDEVKPSISLPMKPLDRAFLVTKVRNALEENEA